MSLSLVADYGSDSDTEEPEIKEVEAKNNTTAQPPTKKSGLFSKLPPPKPKDDVPEEKTTKTEEPEAKKKVHTFTVPINPESLKKRKDEDRLEADEGERPKKKIAPSSTLPFLPAPKNNDLYDQAKRVNTEIKNNVTKSSSKRVLSFKQNPQLASLLQDESSPQVEAQTGHEAANQEQEQEVAASTPATQSYDQAYQQHAYGNYQSAEDYHRQLYQQQYQDYYNQQQFYNADGTINYRLGQQQQQYFSNPVAGFKDPLKNAPRDFRELRGLGANIVDINQDERKKEFPKYRAPDYFEEQMNKTRTTASVMPDRSQKRQGHISYLLHEFHMKEADLAIKKAEGLKTRKETKMKYGW
jgi:hypothetical protein